MSLKLAPSKNTNLKPKTRFISIETTSFSGATLLVYLLGAHPQIATIAEMDGLLPSESADSYLCSCGKIIANCDFWDQVQQQMQKRNVPFDLNHFDMAFKPEDGNKLRRLKYGSSRNILIDSVRDFFVHNLPREREHLRNLTNRNISLIESILAVSQKEIFVDSSKDPLRYKILGQKSELDIKIIHLVRDVRGVVASDIRHGKTEDPSDLARSWMRRHERLSTFAQTHKDQYLRIRYEDLCREPANTLKSLFAFCDADTAYSLESIQRDDHHLIGNSMRLNGISDITLDERWKRSLNLDQVKEIMSVAGSLNHSFGYK